MTNEELTNRVVQALLHVGEGLHRIANAQEKRNLLHQDANENMQEQTAISKAAHDTQQTAIPKLQEVASGVAEIKAFMSLISPFFTGKPVDTEGAGYITDGGSVQDQPVLAQGSQSVIHADSPAPGKATEEAPKESFDDQNNKVVENIEKIVADASKDKEEKPEEKKGVAKTKHASDGSQID